MNTKIENKKRYSSLTPAVEQAAAVLKYLASEPGIKASLTDISQMVDVNKSKTFAILGALQIAGFVLKEDETKLYSLGPELIPIGQSALKNIDYRNNAKPFIEKLARETMCSVLFGIIHGEKLLIILKQASGQEVDSRLETGSSRDLFFHSHGKAIFASLPEDKQNKLLSGKDFLKEPNLSVMKNSVLKNEIREIKAKGYAWNTGMISPMIKVLSSAVIGHNNHPIGAIIIMGLIDQSDIPEYGKKLVEAAYSISNTLGANK